MKKKTLKQKREFAESMRRFKNGECPCPCHFKEVQCIAHDVIPKVIDNTETYDEGIGCYHSVLTLWLIALLLLCLFQVLFLWL